VTLPTRPEGMLPLGMLSEHEGIIYSTWPPDALCPDQRNVTEEDLRRIGWIPEAELSAIREASLPLEHSNDECYGGPCTCGLAELREALAATQAAAALVGSAGDT